MGRHWCCRRNQHETEANAAPEPATEDVKFTAPEEEMMDLEPILPFDIDSFRLTFVFSNDEPSQEAPQELYQVYFEYCRMFGTFQCSLRQLLFDSPWIPETATHLMCSFTTQDGKKVGIPFALADGDDVFPFESLAYITDRPLYVAVLESDDNGQVTKRDVTEEIHDLSWNLFNAGFSKFRPTAWTWLINFYPSPDAALIMEHEDGSQAALHVQTGILDVC